MNLKRITVMLALFGSMWYGGFAQATLDGCLEKARDNYPLIKRYRLIEQAKNYSLSNASKAYLPQLQVNIKASYQSGVVELPLDISDLTLPALRKDQYMAVAEAKQLLWDGGTVSAQKRIVKAHADVEKGQVDVDLYAVDERVLELYFGILLLDAQLEQNTLLSEELDRNYGQVAEFLENGIAGQSDLDAVRVEQLKVKHARIGLSAARDAYVEMLSLMTGDRLTGLDFLKPPAVYPNVTPATGRPEFGLFDAQNRLLDARKSGIGAAYMPRIGLFIQGGAGRPALNMLSNAFEPFYVGGISLIWNFGALYTRRNDLQAIENDRQGIDVQRSLLLYNIHLSGNRENAEVRKLREQVKGDEAIVILQESIRRATEAQFSDGMAMVNDLLREVSKEDAARHTKAAHEIELLRALYRLKHLGF
jgi:outer membrane protein TolC